jgi:hypothetical protein
VSQFRNDKFPPAMIMSWKRMITLPAM